MSVVLSLLFFISALPPISLPGPGLVFLLPFLILSSRNNNRRLSNSLLLSATMAAYLFYGVISYHLGVFLFIVLLFTLAFSVFLLISTHWLINYPLRSVLIIPLFWLIIELLFNSFRIPLTMALVAIPVEIIHPVIELGGQHLLGVLVVMSQIMIASIWFRYINKNKDIQALAIGVITLTILLVQSGSDLSEKASNLISVSLIQTNIHPHKSLSLAADGMVESLHQHRRTLLEQAVANVKTDLLILPEISIAHYEMLKTNNISKLAQKHKISLLLASPHQSVDGLDYQSVFSIGTDGHIQERRDKTLLIPFLEKEFNSPNKNSWTPHTQLPGKPGSLICFESVFSYPAVELSRNGAGFIAITTNDAYAGPSILPMVHFELARLRAIETGRTVVRAANAGISAIITPHGRVQQQLDLFEKGFINAKIEPVYQLTFYAKYYWQWQIIFWSIAIFSVFMIFYSLVNNPFNGINIKFYPGAIVKFIGLAAIILLQHFVILSLFEVRTKHTIENKLATFQSNLPFLPYYTQLLADHKLSSIDSGLTYVLRSHGNIITSNQLITRYSGLGHLLRIPLILKDFRLLATKVDFRHCPNRTSCLGNYALVILKHGEMVVIDDRNDDFVMFFSPHYGRIVMVTDEAFSQNLTNQAWNIKPILTETQI